MTIDKKAIESKLGYLGLDPSLSGFSYLVDIMTIMPDGPASIVELYSTVAKANGTTKCALERCVRHLIEQFYSEQVDVHPLLRPSVKSGRLTNGQFIYKLRLLLLQDTWYMANGSTWALLNIGDNLYEVRVFIAGGNYRALRGTHDECINYIMIGGITNVV